MTSGTNSLEDFKTGYFVKPIVFAHEYNDMIIASDWKTGNPLDPQYHLGALVDKAHFKKVSSYLKKGKAVIGGNTEKDRYVYRLGTDNLTSLVEKTPVNVVILNYSTLQDAKARNRINR